MIGRVEHDQIALARVRARQPKRQLVRLAARVHEVADAKRIRQRRREPLRVAHQVVVQVARVRVEHAHLLRRRLHDAGMRVAHVRDVVVRVEVSTARVVVQILHPAAHDFQRLAIPEPHVRSNEPPPLSQQGGREPFAELATLLADSAKAPDPISDDMRIAQSAGAAKTASADGGGIAASAGSVRRIASWLTDRYGHQAVAAADPRRRTRSHRPQQDQARAATRSLVVQQRIGLLVSADHRLGHAPRIGLVEHGIGDRDREIRDREAVDQIAEIDQARDALKRTSPDRQRSDDVVIVGVVVDHRSAQSREPRHVVFLDPRDDAFDDASQLGVLHLRDTDGARPTRRWRDPSRSRDAAPDDRRWPVRDRRRPRAGRDPRGAPACDAARWPS